MAYSSLMVDIFLKRPRGGGEGGGAGEGGTPYNGLYGEASPKKKPYLGFMNIKEWGFTS